MSATHATRISLRLRELSQLFNSMDPSPFIDRDLDQDAEEFIVSSAREAQGARTLELAIHLGTAPEAQRAAETEEAVQHYFALRAELKRREFRLLLRQGHLVLGIGLLFLTTCLFLSRVVPDMIPTTFADIVREGLIIAGWVAMWRPLEIYLYEWWPLRAEWRSLRRLATMRVRLILPQIKALESGIAAPTTKLV